MDYLRAVFNSRLSSVLGYRSALDSVLLGLPAAHRLSGDRRSCIGAAAALPNLCTLPGRCRAGRRKAGPGHTVLRVYHRTMTTEQRQRWPASKTGESPRVSSSQTHAARLFQPLVASGRASA